MVKYTHRNSRFAFTMIELIFAIVVIAIAVVSLPVMTNATQKGVTQNIIQEAIFAASSELMGITSAYWDEHSMDDRNYSDFARVINIVEAGGIGKCDSITKLRIGHIAQPFHRRCLDNNVTLTDLDKATYNAAAGKTIYSLDDAVADINNTDTFIQEGTGTLTGEAQGYKDVTYKSYADISRTSNMKKIVITIKKGATVITKLITYSANIGEPGYYKRTMP